MRVPFRIILALALAAIFAGCGFQLRGTLSSNLPYKTMFIALEPSAIEILDRLTIQAVEASVFRAGYPKDAEAVFQQLQDSRI